MNWVYVLKLLPEIIKLVSLLAKRKGKDVDRLKRDLNDLNEALEKGDVKTINNLFANL